MKDIFKGSIVRLSAMDAEEIGKALSSRGRDSELMRLMDTGSGPPAFCKGSNKIF